MAATCHGTGRDRHDIPDGDRVLTLTFRIDWGDQDLRDTHEKPLTFCSFQCLADWAKEKAAQHDQHILTAG